MQDSYYFENVKVDVDSGCFSRNDKLNYGSHMPNGYRTITLKDKETGLRTPLYVHRCVWMEKNKRRIPEGMVILHLDDDPSNNSITNLLLGTYSENNKRAVKNKDYEKIIASMKSPVKVEAVCMTDNKKRFFDSMYRCSKALGINPGLIHQVLSKKFPYSKTARSKNFGTIWTFRKNRKITDYS